MCLRKSNQQLFYPSLQKAIRVRTPKRESDELLTKAYHTHERILNYAMVSTQLHRGTKIHRAGFKWVLHIRNHYDLFCLVSLSYMEQTVSIFLRLSVALFFFVILSCMTSSLCLFNLQSRLLFYRRFIADTRTKWQYLKGAKKKKAVGLSLHSNIFL